MTNELDQIFSAFLSEAGALVPVQLGEAVDGTVAPAQVATFAEAMGLCRVSMQRRANLLFAAFLALLLGILVLLYLSQVGNSNTSIVALLGSSGAIGLVAIPKRMQALWRDLVVMQMTLAVLPGQSPKEQLALVKTLHAAALSRGDT